ncbi:MAG: sn-glycerol-3-phosphate ABC transporter substrate-binding protein UgpB [Pseudomonadota bacterium]
MLQKTLLGAAAVLSLSLAGAAQAQSQAQTEITWWHAMGGELGKRLEKIADDFNATQSDYKVTPVYKGSYTETLTAGIAAFRANQQPHIMQVFEVGTATMMAAKGAVYPVYQLMADAKEPFDPKSYISAVVGYYTDEEGNMLSMPFNSSTPVVFRNKEAFKSAGLDPEKAPKTWAEMAEIATKIAQSGDATTCGFTTSWISWIQLENFSAWHNLFFASKDDGFAGMDADLLINQELPLRHVTNLNDWQANGAFKYGGRRSQSAPLFYSGECAMYFGSSAGYAGIRANAKDFTFGVSMLPYYDDVQGVPQNSIIGGASLWVLKGHDQEEYDGVAKFFSYLSSPEVQAWWHQETGYLPITTAAYELTKKQGFYEKNPGTDTPINQINLNPPTAASKGLRLGNFVQIRDVINEEFEEIFSGNKTPKEGLDDAVKRGNDLLRQFQDANS